MPKNHYAAWRKAAFSYVKLGLPVLAVHGLEGGKCTCGDPYCKYPGKHPVSRHGVYDSVDSVENVDKYVQALETTGKYYNLAIAVPKGTVVLDIDPRNGGSESLRKIITDGKRFEFAAAAHTGGGGHHIFLSVPEDLCLPGKIGDYPGIDVKQNGGYVVAAPSTHVSGGKYTWIKKPRSRKSFKTAPKWLTDMGWSRSSTKSKSLHKADVLEDPVLSTEELDSIATLLAPHWVEGQRQDLALVFGGWAAQRGMNGGDIAYIIGELETAEPDMRINAALWSLESGTTFGWKALSALVGEETAEKLSELRNPLHDELLKAVKNGQYGEILQRALWIDEVEQEKHRETLNGFKVFTGKDERFGRKITEIVDGMGIAAGCTTGLVGARGHGKTPLLCDLLLSIQHGLDFHGHKTQQSNCLIISTEKMRTFMQRLRSVAEGRDLDYSAIVRAELTIPLVDNLGYNNNQPNKDLLRAIEEVVKEHNIKVIAMDTYNSCASTVNNNAAEFAAGLRALQAAFPQCAIIVTLHTNKSYRQDEGPPTLNDIDGHGAIGGALDSALGFRRCDDDRFELSTVRTLKGKPFANIYLSAVELPQTDEDSDPPWMWTETEAPVKETTPVKKRSSREEQDAAISTAIRGALADWKARDSTPMPMRALGNFLPHCSVNELISGVIQLQKLGTCRLVSEDGQAYQKSSNAAMFVEIFEKPLTFGLPT